MAPQKYAKRSGQLARRLPSLRSVLAFSLIFTASLVSAFLLRFEWPLGQYETETLLAHLPFIVAIKLLVFFTLQITRCWHAYVSFPELVRLLRATLISTAAVTMILFLLPRLPQFPRSVLMFDACLTACYVGGALSIYRLYCESRNRNTPSSGTEPVLIVGVNDTGVAILRSIRSQEIKGYNPVGLISDDAKLYGREICGVHVVGRTGDVIVMAETLGATSILIVAGVLSGKEVRELIDQCNSHKISVRIVPNVQQIVSGHVGVQPRAVAIEDLLGREPVKLDLEGMRSWLSQRRILVTGSCGSIGSEIARQLLNFSPASLTLVDRSETGQFYLDHEIRLLDQNSCAKVVLADMNDIVRLREVFHECEPEIVFHAAAYKHVPLMEQFPVEAIKNIVGATKNVVDLCLEADVDSLVMISTDKAVNPTSVMGCCKRVAELYVQAASRQFSKKFVTVRFGNVLGSAGSVIPIFQQQIARGGPLTVTHCDMTRYFMTIPEASQLVIQAGALGNGGEIFVLDMGSPVRIMDLAEDLIRLSGLKPGVDIDIHVTGLRPGEKLYEELYTSDEEQSPTVHPKILTAESERLVYFVVQKQVKELLASAGRDPQSIREALAEIVPSYVRPRVVVEWKQVA